MSIPKLSIDQMAEVFELRDKGVGWWNLSVLFSVSESTLRKYHRNAEEYGFDLWIEE